MVGIFSYWYGRSTLQNQLYEQEEVLVEQKVQKITNDLQHYQEEVLVLSKLPVIRQLADTERDVASSDQATQALREEWKNMISQIFMSFAGADSRIYQVRYIDPQGKELVRINNRSGAVEVVSPDRLQNKADRYYIQEGFQLASGEVYVSPVDLNMEFGKIESPYIPEIRFVTPVFPGSGGVEPSLIVINVYASSVMDSLQNAGVANPEALRGHQTIVIDEQGRYLYHPDSEVAFLHLLGQSNNYFADHPAAQEHIASTSALFYYDKMEKEFRTWKKYYYDESAKDRYWVVLSVVDARELFAPVSRFGLAILLSGAGAGVLAGFASFQLSRRIIRPVIMLTERADAIAGGKYETQVDSEFSHSTNELGILARSIEAMRKNILKSRQELERRVDRRTKELQQSLAQAKRQKQQLAEVVADLKIEKTKSVAAAQDLQKFQLAVQNASDQIVITDPDGFIVYANPATRQLTGFAVKDLIGKKAGAPDLWGGLMDKAFYAKLWRTIKIQKKPFFGEVRNKSKSGRRYTAAVSITPILDQRQSVRFFVSTERDITKLKEIDQAKTEFVSLASHQLRTPLSAINWYAEMLLGGDAGKLSRKQKEFMKEIYDGNVRIINLVNSLLNVSRLDLGTFTVIPEAVDLRKMLGSVLREFRPVIRTKSLRLTYEGPAQLISQADRNLARIIMQNIIGNAIKYTPARGRVDIALSHGRSGITLSVRDTGYGIPQSQQEKIFTKLFRADNAKEKETDGNGLGLYIVKSILDQVGGSVTFVSEEGKGSTFTIILPKTGMKKREGEKQIERRRA